MTRSETKIFTLASFAILFLLAACQSQSFRVDSEPAGADVFISAQGQTPRKLGVTPFVIQASEQGDKAQALQVTVSKDGSGSESVLLPPAAMGRAGGMFVRLDTLKLPVSCQNQEAALEKVARGVAESQYQIKLKNLDQAERTLNALTTEYSNVSVLHDLLGNVHFLRKDIDRALASYRRSQTIAPNNSETTRMIKRLEELKGGAR